MEPKLIFAIIAAALMASAYVAYLKNMLGRKTQPHAYTWLIWALTTGTAAFGAWHGGGGWGAVSQTVGATLTAGLFLLSLRYGTRNITRADSIALAAALLAILVWWRLHDPLPAVLMVTGIDLIGYLPTLRKSFSEPWSENLGSWALWIAASVFSLAALTRYNLLTSVYLSAGIVANLVVIMICLIRRRTTPKPA